MRHLQPAVQPPAVGARHHMVRRPLHDGRTRVDIRRSCPEFPRQFASDVRMSAKSTVSLMNCFNRTFGCNSVLAVVAGSVYRDQRKPIAMEAATMTMERQTLRLEDWSRMRSVSIPTLVGQFRSMCQSIRAVPNYDQPNLVVCKLAFMRSFERSQ
jgi:hypothetical protein